MKHTKLSCRYWVGLRVLAVCLAVSFSGISATSAQYGTVPAPPEDLAKGFDSITAEQSEQWLNILAGPKFEGRGTGQPGYTKAAHWVAGKVAEFGLEPIGDNGTYFQMLPMKRRFPVIDECFLTGPNDLKIEAKGNLGLERFTDQQEATGEVVFVNFSGSNTAFAEGTTLRDKIVIYVADDEAARNAPNQLARQRPMAAIRVIKSVPVSISQLIRGGGRRRSTSISGTIIESAALKLAQAVGGDASWLTQPEQAGVVVHEPKQEISMRLRFREEQAAVPNVVAWLEGSDPLLKHEYVVLGSHLDHLGVRGGEVYPGADDNGSGSTAVLNIAKAFATNDVRPKRSIMFIWFAAEEIGLVGSRHYADNPTKPTEDMTCMFNIDMVGRNEEGANETAEENEGSIHLIGSKKGETAIHSLVEKANEYVGFRFEYDEEKVWNRSDQVNFYRKGVPVAFLFDGFHPDYHKTTDQPAKINFKKISSSAKLYYLAVNFAADHGRFQMTEESQSN